MAGNELRNVNTTFSYPLGDKAAEASGKKGGFTDLFICQKHEKSSAHLS